MTRSKLTRGWVVGLLFLLSPLLSTAQDGNRITAGQSTFPDVEQVVAAAFQQPVWLAGGSANGKYSVTYIMLNDTHVNSFQIDENTVSQTLTSSPGVPSNYAGSRALLMPSIADGVSVTEILPDTQAIPFGDSSILFLATGGHLVWWQDGQTVTQLAVNPMPDSQVVINQAGVVALYVEPTERYSHGVLGNPIEAAALAIISTENNTLTESARIQLSGDDVFEGLSPMWADMDGNSVDELVTTVSNAQVGARLVVYKADGSILAETPPLGQGFHWRHQLAVGAFGPDGSIELVEVQTPHIGGMVQFWRYDSQQGALVPTARTTGYTSHSIGSSNLDQTVAGDFNGDGQIELVITTQDRNAIVGLQRYEDTVQELWRLPLSAAPATNFVGLMLPDGRLGLAIGTADRLINVWLPGQQP